MSAPLLLTATQAAELLNVSERYVATLLERGALPSHEAGGQRRVKLGDLLTYERTRDAERADAHVPCARGRHDARDVLHPAATALDATLRGEVAEDLAA